MPPEAWSSESFRAALRPSLDESGLEAKVITRANDLPQLGSEMSFTYQGGYGDCGPRINAARSLTLVPSKRTLGVTNPLPHVFVDNSNVLLEGRRHSERKKKGRAKLGPYLDDRYEIDWGKFLYLLQELVDEAKWDAGFAASADALERLAAEALEEYRAGRTQESGFDQL